MLYTNGFVLAGALAAALTLTAGANAAERAAAEARRPEPLRLGTRLSTSDVDTLTRLSAALESRTVWCHDLTEPDHAIADHARAAAATASGRTRDTLLSLAESAQRSALAFLVDYSLAIGRWEAMAGVRMRAPSLERV